MLAAVIVTFNRKTLLGENIRMLLRQTMPFDKIFIVDNCSTDGTPEYLKEQGSPLPPTSSLQHSRASPLPALDSPIEELVCP